MLPTCVKGTTLVHQCHFSINYINRYVHLSLVDLQHIIINFTELWILLLTNY
jgi:hypothetical protein